MLLEVVFPVLHSFRSATLMLELERGYMIEEAESRVSFRVLFIVCTRVACNGQRCVETGDPNETLANGNANWLLSPCSRIFASVQQARPVVRSRYLRLPMLLLFLVAFFDVSQFTRWQKLSWLKEINSNLIRKKKKKNEAKNELDETRILGIISGYFSNYKIAVFESNRDRAIELHKI